MNVACSAHTNAGPAAGGAQVYVEVRNGQDRFVGDGRWGRDFIIGRGVEEWYLQSNNGSSLNVFALERWDNATRYEIDSKDRDYCRKTPLSGKIPSLWSWVALAEYKGKRHYHGITLDAWEYQAGGVTLGLAVFDKNPDIPIVLTRNTATQNEAVEYRRFLPQAPSPDYFAVPAQCQ